MPQIYDVGPPALLPLRRKACLGIFSPWKIRRLRPDLNPRTWVLEANTHPLDHRSRCHRSHATLSAVSRCVTTWEGCVLLVNYFSAKFNVQDTWGSGIVSHSLLLLYTDLPWSPAPEQLPNWRPIQLHPQKWLTSRTEFNALGWPVIYIGVDDGTI
jgi:hypothetical protein